MKYIFIFLLCSVLGMSQNVTITPNGIGGSTGGLYPRLTYTAILALPSPQAGDLAYDITFKCLRLYTGFEWVCSEGSPGEPSLSLGIYGTISGQGDQVITDMATDAVGNVYVTGYFTTQITISSTTLTAVGGKDIFTAKCNAAGVLQWLRSAGGANSDESTGLSVDGSGNVIVVGTFSGSMQLGLFTLVSAGATDGLVLKYDAAGLLTRSQTMGGSTSDFITDVQTNASGDIFFCGYSFSVFSYGGVNISGGPGNSDTFIIKLNSNGAVQWGRVSAGTGIENALSLAVDATGNVYIGGTYSGTVVFGNLLINGTASSNYFIAKYDPLIDSWAWLTSSNGTTGGIFDLNIGIDNASNVYIAGYFNQTAASVSTQTLTSAGFFDVFLAKLTSTGTLSWARSMGSVTDDRAFDIHVDATGVYICGDYSSQANFSDISTLPVQNTVSKLFVTKYSTSGSPISVKTSSGVGVMLGSAITKKANGAVYCGASFSSSVTLGNINITASNAKDSALIELNE